MTKKMCKKHYKRANKLCKKDERLTMNDVELDKNVCIVCEMYKYLKHLDTLSEEKIHDMAFNKEGK